ncbi:MAG: hypothetical protein M3Y85_08790 [Bacteroidota bacterium]|nr:hypothetical protein [Bacteroidota bacterium]
MKKIMTLMLGAVSLAGCAQMNKTIIKAAAFYTIPTPGTIQVDDRGNPVQPQRRKVYNIFMEIKGPSPEWTKAWVDEKSYSVISLTVQEKKVIIGKKKSDDQKIVMEAGKGNILVQLELSPGQNYKRPPNTVMPGELLLEGKWKGKLFYYKIANVMELASPEYQ